MLFLSDSPRRPSSQCRSSCEVTCARGMQPYGLSLTSTQSCACPGRRSTGTFTTPTLDIHPSPLVQPAHVPIRPLPRQGIPPASLRKSFSCGQRAWGPAPAPAPAEADGGDVPCRSRKVLPRQAVCRRRRRRRRLQHCAYYVETHMKHTGPGDAVGSSPASTSTCLYRSRRSQSFDFV